MLLSPGYQCLKVLHCSVLLLLSLYKCDRKGALLNWKQSKFNAKQVHPFFVATITASGFSGTKEFLPFTSRYFFLHILHKADFKLIYLVLLLLAKPCITTESMFRPELAEY